MRTLVVVDGVVKGVVSWADGTVHKERDMGRLREKHPGAVFVDVDEVPEGEPVEAMRWSREAGLYIEPAARPVDWQAVQDDLLAVRPEARQKLGSRLLLIVLAARLQDVTLVQAAFAELDALRMPEAEDVRAVLVAAGFDVAPF